MSPTETFRTPPRTLSHDGSPRRVGVELEFAAVSALDGAKLVQAVFGGTVEEEDPHRFLIRNCDLGDFRSELDTQYAHPENIDKAENKQKYGKPGKIIEDFGDRLRSIVGDISSLVVPCEIVCPPITITNLRRLDELIERLRQSGAAGTRANPLYAFGAQLNPEIADGGTDWIISVMKAYLLLSDWLRAVTSIDPTRRLFSFTDPFPSDYAAMVVDPDYKPDFTDFIDDYLKSNPTRNRELDMLPLFTWFDEARVRKKVEDPRIKARPTFHYRLPDADFGEQDWSIAIEWNRWCLVERLAEQHDKLDAMGSTYRANQAKWISGNWAIESSEWLLVR